jgi:small subunit ribosomal protein S9
VVKKKEEEIPVAEATVVETIAVTSDKPSIAGGRYVFATGRRKTAVANIRLFSGKGETLINKKPLDKYFYHSMYRDVALKPLQLTGLLHDFYFTAQISGSGINAQAYALAHALAQAIGGLNEDMHRQMKRSNLLTRDDRKKERKKPGLKGARRSPQWAKR